MTEALPPRVLPEHLRTPAQELCLRAKSACVWSACLPDFTAAPIQELLTSWLHSGELTRLEHCRNERRRQQFLLGRAVLRCLLTTLLRRAPGELVEDQYGKPRLAETTDLDFSISHSGDWLYLALARDMPLGVDIEQIDTNTDYLGLARRFFSPQEQAALTYSRAPTHDFYRCWVRKESFLKGCTRGLGFGLSRFSVAVGEEPNPTPIVIDSSAQSDPRPWFNHNLPAPPDHVAALAVPEPGPCIVRVPLGVGGGES